ncbi:hypothetical protein QFZ27_003224 [Inquilinus ginsengisoli]|uniref:rhamnan synthesis F family protein n=1 Tax=Inquilinus ginsengisoli TaxID=363840 RepID=UPI003D1D3395
MTQHRRSFVARMRRSAGKRWRRLRGLPPLPGKQPPPLRQADERTPFAAAAWLDVVKPYVPAAMPGEVALFVTHSRDGRSIRRHVEHYVRALQAEGIAVVLIVASDAPEVTVPPALATSLAGLYVRQNVGFDFAAWAHVMQRELALFRSDALYLINDSLYGPFNAKAFGALMARLRAADADIVGLTESHEKGWHLQSFFLRMKRRAFSSPKFHHFWQDVRNYPDKQDVIDLYEVTFCGRMRAAGLTCIALFENLRGDNQTAFAWRELIERGFPFFKAAVLRGDLPPTVTGEGWKSVLAAHGYDTGLVDTGPDADLPALLPAGLSRHRRRRALVDRLRSAPMPLRLACIGSWTSPGETGEASRCLVSALFHSEHEINLHPQPGTGSGSAPEWTVRSFDGAADVVLISFETTRMDPALTALCADAALHVGIMTAGTPGHAEAWPVVDAVLATDPAAAEVIRQHGGIPVRLIPALAAATDPRSAAAGITAALLDLLPAA